MAFAQPTFSDLEASPGRMTRHRRFPGPLDLRIPWDAWAADRVGNVGVSACSDRL